jgi:amino acid adenylation domain-containing protein
MQTLTGNFRPVPDEISELRDNYPDAIALSYGERQLSYTELDRQAERFAGYLAQHGVTPGGTVAICMERSLDWIVAALGIMRAGAAYVPLDPAWPDARLRFAVNDSGATSLVARATLLDRLQVQARGIDSCRDAAAIAAAPLLPRRAIESESLAYVIYTSGSTGVPKGVEITHANLAHLVRWHREVFSVTRRDRASHLAGLGFDAAVWEIWPHLSAGATLCLADDAVRSSPELMQQWMIRERVTIGFVPTVHAAPMMAMEWPATTALRFLLTGGDALRHGPALLLPFEVVNNYGPTETTVVATYSVLQSGSHSTPPIGRPISGASVYLLDEAGHQVPDGSTGEIYVGGSGVGRGYRNLPELTERSFLLDPFLGTAVPGSQAARMYRTGDRGARRPDGEIEFRGRLDRQTKIRGQRIELDEIGSILTQRADVDFATAVARVSQGGENQIVAYVLPKENLPVPTAHELQNHLLRTLPDYMVPAIFVRLNALPISPNGKLDLTMLAQPSDAQLLESRAEKAPASAIEEKLLGIMRGLLGNNAIAVEDSFFLAGGHSLLGMQLVMRLREAFGVDLTLRQLFEAPTVERLAFLVETILEEDRLKVIWSDLLGRKQVKPDDNFVNLSGDPALVDLLQQRIATEFGEQISTADLVGSPTFQQQAKLVWKRAKGKPALPPGVLALQPNGSRGNIFWLHYLSPNLGKVIGNDQPLLYVALTGEDFPTLGKTPTLQIIASCLLQKIRAAQPKGPYAIGGYCLGGILAYEIASQLRAGGNDVSLVVLVDPPNPAYIESCDSLERLINYLGYATQRAARLGWRISLDYLSEHVIKYAARILRSKSTRTEMGIAQRIIEVAALKYHPTRYDGEVLLLLASERPSYVDRFGEWQAVVPQGLHAQYLNAHHRDLLKPENVRNVAEAIVTHLGAATDGKPVSCYPNSGG